MAYQMHYSHQLTLEEIAMRSVIVKLWNEPEILVSIKDLIVLQDNNLIVLQDCLADHNFRQLVVKEAKAKFSELEIPKKLKERMAHIITPIGLQIKSWIEFHEKYLRMEISEGSIILQPILAKLCWTSAGTVDYEKTAEALIRFEQLHASYRYILACLYCLEGYIPALWEQLSTEMKQLFYDPTDTSKIENWRLEFCWPYILHGKQSELDSIIKRIHGNPGSLNLRAFTKSAYSVNKAATEYFFRKLSNEEKHNALIKTFNKDITLFRTPIGASGKGEFPSQKISDVLCYLFSQMNQEQQMKTIRSHTYMVLLMFLETSRKDAFLKLLEHPIWNDLPNPGYFYYGNPLVRFLIDVSRRLNDSIYVVYLFQEFFKRIPNRAKTIFVDHECYNGQLFKFFFEKRDSETLEIIFRNLDLASRRRLVSCKSAFSLFDCYIAEESLGMLDMVEMCLREATLSAEDREEVKNEFKELIRGPLSPYLQIPVSKRFDLLLEETSPSAQGKKTAEEEEHLNRAKKHCSDQIRAWKAEAAIQMAKEMERYREMFKESHDEVLLFNSSSAQ